MIAVRPKCINCVWRYLLYVTLTAYSIQYRVYTVLCVDISYCNFRKAVKTFDSFQKPPIKSVAFKNISNLIYKHSQFCMYMFTNNK